MRTWKRWGSWKAHLYENGKPICPFPTSNYRRGVVLGANPGKLVTLNGSDLSRHGVPYAQVCSYCLKRFQMTPTVAALQKEWDSLSESEKKWVRHKANWESRSISAILSEYEVPSSFECRMALGKKPEKK